MTYSITIGGPTALPDQKGQAVLEDGVWKVCAKSFHDLLELEPGQSGASARRQLDPVSRGLNAGGDDGDDGADGGRRPGRALATLCAVLFLTFLDTTIVSVALADVQSTLHAGVSQLQWVVNGYALVFASLMLAAGTLGDRLGRKRVMLAGARRLLRRVARWARWRPTVDVLIAARAIMGVGAAASEPGTLSILRHLTRSAARAPARSACGPPSPAWRWRWGRSSAACWSGSAAGATSSGSTSPPAAVLRRPRSSRARERRPADGAARTSPASSSARWRSAPSIFAVILGETHGYAVAVDHRAVRDRRRRRSCCFVVAERRSPAPMIDLRYSAPAGRSRARSLVAFAAYFGIFSIFFFTALYLQVVIGYSAYRMAALFIPMAAAMIARLGARRALGRTRRPAHADGARLPRRRPSASC